MLLERVAVYHMRNEWVPGIEPMISEVTGTDVNFEHRSHHCALCCMLSAFSKFPHGCFQRYSSITSGSGIVVFPIVDNWVSQW
jgi:hypothetical protein